ncbi:MAG: hypothetical protein R3B81_02585 [bacterium]
MKLATSLVTVFALCACTAANADVRSTTDQGLDRDSLIAQKNAAVSGINNPVPNVGGDNIGSAVNIPAIPYNDGGNTCSFLNDYDEVCPYSGSTSPDVVYSYSPAANGAIDVSLCNSLYDTKVYVYENAAGNLIACNDDDCGSDGFKSFLGGVPVSAGNTYYIVVDGYGGDCGDYSLDVTENVPCIVDCPVGGVAEGEVDCFDDYNDVTNGGCNSTPNVFSTIPCDPGAGLTVCGTYGGFFHSPSGFNYRDTDWYEISENNAGVTVCVTGEYDTLTGYLAADCSAPAFVESAVIGGCDVACFNIPAGNYWVFVATSGFGSVSGACGGNYNIAVEGNLCTVGVEATSWSKIKADHR